MVQSKGATDAVLSFKEDIFDYSENKELGTPEELFRYFPLLQRDFKSKNKNDWIKTDKYLNPSIINADQHFFSSEPLIICDLYIRFEFYERARLHFEMYGEGEGVVTDSIISASTTTIEPTTTEYPETSTKKANKRRVSLPFFLGEDKNTKQLLPPRVEQNGVSEGQQQQLSGNQRQLKEREGFLVSRSLTLSSAPP